MATEVTLHFVKDVKVEMKSHNSHIWATVTCTDKYGQVTEIHLHPYDNDLICLGKLPNARS